MLSLTICGFSQIPNAFEISVLKIWMLIDLLGNLYLLTFVRLVLTILQQFFGTIKIAAGSNDHPATPTFLKLYKMLLTYSILKPPVSGNCTVTDEKPPPLLISVTDLKNIYKPERSSHVEETSEIGFQHRVQRLGSERSNRTRLIRSSCP